MNIHARLVSLFGRITLIQVLTLLARHAPAEPIGSALNFRGQLNQSGLPAVGVYDLRFAIYDAAEEGVQVGATVTNRGVNVINGLFTARLDFGDIVFFGEA